MKVIPKEKLIVRESFAMFYHGGEIWFEQLDALSIHRELVIEKFLKEIQSVGKPSSPSYIGINLNETQVDEEMIHIIITELVKIKQFIKKLVFVGLDRTGKKLVKKEISYYKEQIEFQIHFENDYEKAKEWLL